MTAPADDPLFQAAAAISDRTEVDWSQVEGAADPEVLALAAELQLVERIARVHASPAWDSLRIVGAVGHGSFGSVYRAFDPDLEREVALKVINAAAAAADPEHAVREARLLARVKHPNVVTVFRAERRGAEAGIWMEFVDGKTLDALVKERGAMSAREAALIGLDLCRALAAVHAAGLIHGDVKAHNVMREQGGRIVLMDFGAGRDVARQIRPEGHFAGTPLYVAPEIFRGEPRTTASDIYSLGVLLYYLTTATYPVEGQTRTEIGRLHDGPAARRRLRDVRADLPAAFVQAVERATADDPKQRFRTAGEFEQALLGAFARPRWPRAAMIALAVVAAAALTGGTALWRFGNLRAPQGPASTAAAAGGGVSASSYQVDAGLYRVRPGGDERLAAGARVEPGDQLYFRIATSTPAHVYVINEDDHGESYLLYPLPGQSTDQPLPAGTPHELPGIREGEQLHWQVTSAGGREHFLIFANPDRLTAFEQLFAALPPASADQQVASTQLTRDAVGLLRGVGGLTSKPPSGADASIGLAAQFTTPLADGAETTRGLWVRQVTLENPAQK